MVFRIFHEKYRIEQVGKQKVCYAICSLTNLTKEFRWLKLLTTTGSSEPQYLLTKITFSKDFFNKNKLNGVQNMTVYPPVYIYLDMIWDDKNKMRLTEVVFFRLPKSEDQITGHWFEISSNVFLHVIGNRLVRVIKLVLDVTGDRKCLKNRNDNGQMMWYF